MELYDALEGIEVQVKSKGNIYYSLNFIFFFAMDIYVICDI